MRRFGAIWFVCVFLKLMTFYTIVVTIIEIGFFVPSSYEPSAMWMGQRLPLTPMRSFLLNASSHVLHGFALAALYWGAAEAIRMIANTEAYSRGLYGALRKRSASQAQQFPPQSNPAARKTELTTLRRAVDESYRPRKKWGDSSGYEDAPIFLTRRIGKVHDRPDSAVRPPRPAGEVDVIQKLDEPEAQSLPFDRV